MNRRGNNSIEFVTVLLVALAVVVVAILILNNGKKSAVDSIENLQNCEGVVGSLGGQGAKCSPDKACLNNEGDDYYYQYIGQGWGCPQEDKGTVKKAPYCCLKLSKSDNPRRASDVSKARCDAMPAGTLAFVIDGACKDVSGVVMSPTDKFSIRYYFKEEDKMKTACSFSLTLGKYTVATNEPTRCFSSDKKYVDLFGEVSDATPIEVVRMFGDVAELNSEMSMTVSYNNGGSIITKSAVIQKANPPYCSKRSEEICIGATSGSVVNVPGTSYTMTCTIAGQNDCTAKRTAPKSFVCTSNNACKDMVTTNMPCKTYATGIGYVKCTPGNAAGLCEYTKVGDYEETNLPQCVKNP